MIKEENGTMIDHSSATETCDALDNNCLLSDAIGLWASSQPQATALVFLAEGEVETESMSYLQMHGRAMAVAQHLKEQDLDGQRALLLFHSSIDYVTTFLGCLYAGVIAIPVFPPRQNRHAARVAAISKDAAAEVILTQGKLKCEIEDRMSGLECGAANRILAIDEAVQDHGPDWITPD